MMKALVYEKYAKNDDFASILEILDIKEPKPKPNEVIFEVKTAALNYDDIWGMRGKPIEIPLPHISGTDAAGKVIAIGDDVRHLKVGDRIVSHGNLSCRVCKSCTRGREYDCRYRKVWGFQTGPLWGGFCQTSHLPEFNAVKIPDGISYDEAAAASMTMMTSWHMLVGRAKILPGQTVVIMGGSSGMGTFGIQIAKMHGCNVISTSGPDNLDKCKRLGADHVVNHRRDGWDQEIKEIAKGISSVSSGYGDSSGYVDVIFEHIGGLHWGKEIDLLNYGSTIVTTGATTGYDVRTDLHKVISKGINILGSTQGTRAELEQGLYWMSQGKIKSVIDSRFSLEDAAKAHTKMLKGGIFGKILIKPNG